MQIMKPSKLGIFQMLIACLLVALFTCPGEAHFGPMLVIKGGHGGGGSGAAAAILATGILLKLLTEAKHHHKESSGEFSGGHGYGGGGYPRPGNGMGHSFESHDAHLQDYGYEPQGYAWAK